MCYSLLQKKPQITKIFIPNYVLDYYEVIKLKICSKKNAYPYLNTKVQNRCFLNLGF